MTTADDAPLTVDAGPDLELGWLSRTVLWLVQSALAGLVAWLVLGLVGVHFDGASLEVFAALAGPFFLFRQVDGLIRQHVAAG